MEKARALARKTGVTIETEVADLADFDMGCNKWDAIVSIFCHLPPPLRSNVHRRVVEGLKPGGIFILEAYTPKQLEYKTGGPHESDMMMTLEGLMSELRGLNIELGQEIERDVVEGKYHTGKAHVVQVRARKPE